MKNDQLCRSGHPRFGLATIHWDEHGGNHGGCFHRISSNSKAKVEKNPEEGLGEDEDVQMEKARVKEALSCRSCEEVGRSFTCGRCSRELHKQE